METTTPKISQQLTEEEIFNQVAEKIMIEWDMKVFEKTYPTLLTAIRTAMRLHAEKQVEEIAEILEKIKMQASIWAGEAKAQRGTINEIGALLDGMPDWGPVVKTITEKLARLDQYENGPTVLKLEFYENLANELELLQRGEIIFSEYREVIAQEIETLKNENT